jgi:hypothetical protein
MMTSLNLRQELAALNELPTDELYAFVAKEASALGFADEDPTQPPALRGTRVVGRLLPVVRSVLCGDTLYRRALHEPPLKTPVEIAAIAADIFLGTERLAGFPVCAVALIVVREFNDKLCEA